MLVIHSITAENVWSNCVTVPDTCLLLEPFHFSFKGMLSVLVKIDV